MKIALNLANLRGFGSGLVGRNVLHALSRICPPHELRAWVPHEWGWSPGHLAGIELHIVRGGVPAKLITENATIRGAIRTWPADALFSLGDTSLPFCPIPHLLLVHQPYIAYPEAEWGFSATWSLRARMRLIASYFSLGLSSVSLITVQTEHMRRAICQRWRFSPEHIVVIPSAIEPIGGAATIDSATPFVCYVASASPHKNHVLIADIMAALAAKSIKLRCLLTVDATAVPELCARAERLGVLHHIEFLGPVAQARAHSLMRSATAVLMPSKMETFGIPLWEAMALGAPLIASDLDFAREACADAALYADPNDGAQWADRIAKVVNSPARAAEQGRRAAARHRQAAIAWDDIAARYLKVLEGLCLGPGSPTHA